MKKYFGLNEQGIHVPIEPYQQEYMTCLGYCPSKASQKPSLNFNHVMSFFPETTLTLKYPDLIDKKNNY
jgi:hypothetical protein